MTDLLVTGAAGGLGSALVDLLVARGDRVVALDRTDAPREGVLSFVTDVRDEQAIERAFAEAAGAGIHPRHVVAIAGGALPDEKTVDDPAEISLELFRASLEHNLVSVWATVRAALPRLRRLDGDRSITLTTSTDALASYGLPAYAAAKAGLIGLVHSLMGTLAAEGIRINAVAPGDVPTERNRREWAHRPDWYEQLRAGVPLGRLASPDDIATAYAALIDLRHVTGQVIVVDGGQTITRPAATAT
jgi:NAD(P)-dependent dehydrogenase (short-subunit alcohol dehydrogenase family)